MRTLDIGKLRQEREQLTKRIQQLDVLLAAVAAFDCTAPKKAGRPVGTKRKLSPEALAAIRKGQKARRARERAEKKAKA